MAHFLDMKNLTNSRNSESKLSGHKPCANLCGLCHSCVFAQTPAVSGERLWTVGDSFHRKFLMDLLSRCRSLQVLEKVQRVLHMTSWTVFSYSRSNTPCSNTRTCAKTPEIPHGFSGAEVREWFDSSPDWIKSHYLCCLLLRCDTCLLKALANLTSVLIIRQRRGLLTFEGCNTNEESDEPAIMVVPGSSLSYSGISRYKDFISDLPVFLAKKILGFLNEPTLKICEKVSMQWLLLAKSTLQEIDFRKKINEKITELVKGKDKNIVSPNYANIAKVHVPISEEEGQLKMKLVQMEERNIYCGGYFTTEVMETRDPHRVIDYDGKSLMAVGSKDGVMHLLYVSVEARVVSVLRGNVVQIRVVRFCEDRDLVVTGSFDAVIRCWNIKSETCEMTLMGHTGAVNCLDVCGDRLASGARDKAVKIWDLQNGEECDEYNFKHPKSVQCVKISQTRVYSSCDKGQVRIWDLEKASMLKVIDGHQSPVKCIFFNEWYLLTGDTKGLVMAWSTNCDVKDCLRVFNHPKEVKSLTLSYLRVVTGCDDGKIRIFNFLTGACLRVIAAGGAKGNRILSVHFHETSIVVNSVANVTLHHFGEVFWDYVDSEKKDKKCKQLPASAPPKKVSSPEKTHNRRKSLPCLTRSTSTTQEQNDSFKVTQSEKAASERMKKRGPHHPPTRDSILLKINSKQKATCLDQASVNMERNSGLRDDWSSKVTSSQASKASISSPKSALKRQVSIAQGHIIKPSPPQEEKTTSHGTKTQILRNKSAKSSSF